MRFELGTVFVAIFLLSSQGGAEDSTADRALLNIAATIYEPIAEEVEGRLKDSHLSPEGISSRIEAAADGYAGCLVDFIQSNPDSEFQEALRLLADGKDDSELKSVLGAGYRKIEEISKNHKSEIEGCFLSVQQYLGIPGGLLVDS